MENSAYEPRKQALIDEITAAFDGVSREGGVSLHEAQVIFDCLPLENGISSFHEVAETASAEERAAARLKDTETRWQDVPDEDIAYGDSCLHFLDPIGFRYYIPAYIIWFLRNIDNDDPESPALTSDTFNALPYALHPQDWGGYEKFFLEKYRFFTPEQSKAIAHFLEFDAASTEADHLEIDKATEGAFEEKIELWLQETLSEIGLTQDIIDARKHEFKQLRREHILAKFKPFNSATQALKRYWGQFL